MTTKTAAKQQYQAMDFSYLLGLPGFSDKLLQDHFKLYEGYVKNTNQMIELMAAASKSDNYKGPGLADMKRRFGWEFDGMRLHEYYFGNLAKDASSLDGGGALYERISESFGSLEHWRREFAGMGAMRGVGWVMLVNDETAGRLFNVWINEHDSGMLAGCSPLLVMDVFEHAFMTDYGLEKERYVASFFKAIDWEAVERRFDARGRNTAG